MNRWNETMCVVGSHEDSLETSEPAATTSHWPLLLPSSLHPSSHQSVVGPGVFSWNRFCHPDRLPSPARRPTRALNADLAENYERVGF